MTTASSRQWFSAAELAGLPGMPQTKSAVLRRATADGWVYRDETGRGGIRREYSLQQLPAVTRAALAWAKTAVLAGDAAQSARTAGQIGAVEGSKAALQQDLQQQATDSRQLDGLARSNTLPAKAQLRMDAKLEVLRAFDLYVRENGFALNAGEYEFAAAYRANKVAMPAWARQVVPSVSTASLERWRRQIKARGITALAGAYGNRKGASKVDTQANVREFVQAMLVKWPHARASHVLKALQARMRGDLVEGTVQLPSLTALERWIKAWRADNADLLLAIGNPDGWKNKYMVAFGSKSEGVERLNQLWELDSSPADVMCTDGRYSILGVIDVAPRRPKLHVSKTSKAAAVAALIRRALLDWGVPEEAKTDNGSDYVSNHITRVFSGLAVEHTLCPPFQPWHKPHIERLFGTFTRGLAELLPGYIGHSVADRSAIEARQSFADRLMKRGEVVEVGMSSQELQAFCDRWVDDIYMHNPHGGLNGATPFEAVAAAGDVARRIADERALDVLLAAAPENNGRRTVQKKGLRLDDAWFIAPELEAWVGSSVQVRFDELEHDLGRIFVFGEVAGMGLQFICVAECPERTGMDRRVVAAKAKALQLERTQAARRILKTAAKRVGTDSIVEEVLRDRATQAGKLATLPQRSVPHESAGLAAASAAAAELQRPTGTSADVLAIDGVAATWQRLQEAQAKADAAKVPHGTPNQLATRRNAGGVATPEFETVHQRVLWVLQQQHMRDLSGEEREALADYRREQPASYRRLAATVAAARKEEDPARVQGETGSE